MDKQRAIELLEAVADGINPFTGEILPENDMCNHPEIIRALYALINQPNRPKGDLPENAGKPWTAEESELLIREFDSGMSLKSITESHKRTRGSIRARLVKLGKIDNRSQFM